MAQSFGGGINPQLGAVNYGSFLQGSLAGSQMRAQGMGAIGQGIASAGSSIGQAIQVSADLKEKNKQAKGTVDMAAKLAAVGAKMTNVPEDLKGVFTDYLNLASDPDVSMSEKAAQGDVLLTKGMEFLNMGMEAAKQKAAEEEAARQRKAIADAYAPTSNVQRALGAGASFEQLPQGAQAFMPQARSPQEQAAIMAQAGVSPNEIAGLTNAMAGATRAPGGKMLDPVGVRGQDEQGNPIEITYDRLTGREMSRGPVSTPPRQIRTPEEDATAKELTLRSGAAFDGNQGIVTAGRDAHSQIRDIDQTMAILDSGATTGFGEEFLLKGKQLLARMGADVGDIAGAEQLRVMFGNQVMSRVQQTKGAISNKEMDLFKEFSPNLGNTPEGNKQILQFAKEAHERTITLARKVRDWRSAGDSESVIEAKVADYQEENPLPVLKKMAKGAGGPRIISVEPIR